MVNLEAKDARVVTAIVTAIVRAVADTMDVGVPRIGGLLTCPHQPHSYDIQKLTNFVT